MKIKKITFLFAIASISLISCGSHNGSTLSISSSTESNVISLSVSDNSSLNNSVASSNIVSLNNNSSKSTSSQSLSDKYWTIDSSLYGEKFRDHLASQIESKKSKTCSRDNSLKVGGAAAAYPTSSSRTFVPFYHTTDTLVTTSDCNREHTWPNSRGTGDNCFGDPFILRPTLTSENSDRQNFFYGTGGKSNKEWDPASCGFEGSRGECARLMFYVATLYASKGLSLSNNPYDSTSLKTMGTLKSLVEWNYKYPVTDIEIQINEYLYSQGYGRNPFVDHPEYANYIWDENGLLTKQYNRISSMDNISDYDAVAIVCSENDSTYKALTNVIGSSNSRIAGSNVSLSSDKEKMRNIDNYYDLTFYTFNHLEGDQYSIVDRREDIFLYNSVTDSINYNISYGNFVEGESYIWHVYEDGNNGFIIKGDKGVYLSLDNGMFVGSNSPKGKIYLYK